MRELGVVLIGCGYWGKNLLRTLLKIPDYRVIAVCDSNAKTLKAAQEAFSLNLAPEQFVSDYTSFLEDKEVRAFVIATPPATHFNIALACLKKGKHLFIEKPMTETAKEARRLIKISKETKTKIMTGHTFVYNSGIQYVKELIDSGKLGTKLFYLTFNQQNLGKYQDCGVVYDLAAHGLSIADYLLDGREALRVEGSYGRLLQKHLADWASITLMYKDNIAFNLNISWLHPLKIRELTVVGNEAMVIFNDIQEPRVRLFNKAVFLDSETASSWGETRFKYTHGDIVIPQVPVSEPLKNEMQAFAQYLRTGKKPPSDIRQGYRIVKLIEQLHKESILKEQV